MVEPRTGESATQEEQYTLHTLQEKLVLAKVVTLPETKGHVTFDINGCDIQIWYDPCRNGQNKWKRP